ncbi:MAG TPA: mycofactocin biosynthesis glycosyltransferase MftF, partial [Acidimicrobiales bacterium]|nr:mycofactocin biosynthesis glycosyltransferase MftF [Acidimicrobiales bacterium]
MTVARLPSGYRVVLDAGTRSVDGGRVLIGGAPLRIMRLSAAGARVVEGWRTPGPVPASDTAHRLARRLVGAGMAHPVPDRTTPPPPVTVVVPVRDDAEGLGRLLASLDPVLPVIVVDDGSADAGEVASVARRSHARLLRHDAPRGPAAARNLGWRAADTPLVAFVDADVDVGTGAPAGAGSSGWLEALAAHFADPCVAAVAPRVETDPGDAPVWLAAYEMGASPLDMGPSPSEVRPGARVPYLPAAAIVVRRSALFAVGGFDESLRLGEDVDLVWRLAATGWSVRYEPSSAVAHRVRGDLGSWMGQRFGYGTSAAALDRRHRRAAPPLRVS